MQPVTRAHRALKANHPGLVDALLSIPGANPSIAFTALNHANETPLELGIGMTAKAGLETLLTFASTNPKLLLGKNQTTGNTVLHSLAGSHLPNIARAILKLIGSDAKTLLTPNSNKNTPVHLATVMGDSDTLRQLLQIPGVDSDLLTAKNEDGYTPIDLAIRAIQGRKLWMLPIFFRLSAKSAVKSLVGL